MRHARDRVLTRPSAVDSIGRLDEHLIITLALQVVLFKLQSEQKPFSLKVDAYIVGCSYEDANAGRLSGTHRSITLTT